MEIKKFGNNVQRTVVNQNNVVKPNLLSQDSVSTITERLKDEYKAYYFYKSASNWCKNVNYKKATEFFEKESTSELEHANGLQDYLIDFNIQPEIPQTETNFNFQSLVQIINEAYQLEYDLMQKYNESSAHLFTSDLTTFDFLQKYRNLQKESVVEYSDLLNALVLIDSNDKFQVLYFEQTYF